MNPFVTLKIALRAVLRNKMRSFLTTLGIIIGVAAVIAMMAIGAGAKARVEEAFAAMGTNLLIVLPGSSTAGGSKGGFGSQPTITWDQAALRLGEATAILLEAARRRSEREEAIQEARQVSGITLPKAEQL